MTDLPECEIRLPLHLDDLDGPYIIAKAYLIVKKDGCGLATLDDFTEISNEPDWTEHCGDVFFDVLDDGVTLRARRIPTSEDFRQLRVPIWIQGEDSPECCGQLMTFVGQLDDDDVWREPPPGARMWWHDVASFYIFTCPKCLSVKAVGQQC